MNTQIHGHRGARGRRPENTLPAVEFALQHAADGIEVDLCITADDTVVLHHDLWLNTFSARDRAGKWIDQTIPIRSLSLRELRQFDIGRLRPGTEYALEFSEQIPVDGCSPATLNEFVELVHQSPCSNTILNLEIKGNPPWPGLVPEPDHHVSLVLGELEQLPLPNRVFVQSFDWRLSRLVKQQRPDLKTGFLTNLQPGGPTRICLSDNPQRSIDVTDLADYNVSLPNMVKQNGGDVWSCNYLDLTRSLVQEAHDLGLEVFVWTVNEERDVLRMAEWAVDVITTDFPDRCRAFL